MRDSTDQYIRQAIKNWTAEQKPPENLRARLLLIAAAAQREQTFSRNSQKSRLDIVIPNLTPLEQAIQLHNLPWQWTTRISLTPLRQVT